MIGPLESSFDHEITVDPGFSLAQSSGPIVWGRGRWPNVDYIDGCLIWVGHEGGRVATRWMRQHEPGRVVIGGERNLEADLSWLTGTFGIERRAPAFNDDVITAIAARYPGVRPFSANSLFEGLVSCIAGQSISVAAAAITHARICALVDPGRTIAGRKFWPSPTAEQLCALDVATVRTSGVTWKRAEAIVAAAFAAVDGQLPTDEEARANPDGARSSLLRLKLVGAWTAESALLWGLGLDDAFPPNDAALLRAAKGAYATLELDHRGLERLAEGWRPGRAWASRWLWTAMFGAPEDHFL